MKPTENPLHRRFFGSHLASFAIKQCLQDAQHIHIATAFFEPSGWDELSDVLVDKHIELLVGREETAYLEQCDNGQMEAFQKACLKTWLNHFEENAENICVVCSLHFVEA